MEKRAKEREADFSVGAAPSQNDQREISATVHRHRSIIT